MVDTTAGDPSAPANRIQGTPETAEPSVEEMVKPAAPEQTPDLEMAPLRVGPDGRPLSGGGDMVLDPMAVPQQQQQQAPGAGEVMEMAPLTVPQGQGAPASAAPGTAAPGAPAPATGAAQPAPPTPAPAAAAATVPATTRAYRAGDLRIVVFSAASDAKAPAYDGIVIELADGAAGHAQGRAGCEGRDQASHRAEAEARGTRQVCGSSRTAEHTASRSAARARGARALTGRYAARIVSRDFERFDGCASEHGRERESA